MKLQQALLLALASVLAAGQVHAAPQSGKSAQQAKADAPRYPNATRKEPAIKVSPDDSKALQAMVDAYSKNDFANALSQAKGLGESGKTPYDKAFAWQVAGNAAAGQKDYANASAYFQNAVTADALDNNSHYDTMNNLVSTLDASGQSAAALKMLDRFIAETRTTDPHYTAVRATLLSKTGQASAANSIYADMLAKNPNDKKTLMNVVAGYQDAGKTTEAVAVLRDAYKRGMLTDAQDYRIYYGLLLQNTNANWKEAKSVLDAGVVKGVVPKNNETATAYMVAGQGAFAANEWNAALGIYGVAESMSTSGEADLNRAKIFAAQGKKAEAKAAAQAALAKGGLKDPSQAQRFLK